MKTPSWRLDGQTGGKLRQISCGDNLNKIVPTDIIDTHKNLTNRKEKPVQATSLI